jgi:peptidyl-prolyl cis-trans isomerase B (cyclophilin B)
MEPHSASCQFFINVNDNTFLDFKNETPQGWGYCVFGQVTSGMEVVNQIKSVATGNIAGYADVPKEDVIIETIEVVKS